MSFAYFEFFATGLGVTLDTITTIAGVSSLSINGVDPALGRMNGLPAVASPIDIGGITVGKLRTLIRPTALGGAGEIGLVAMQSQRDIRTAGDFYYARCTGSVIELRRCTGGMAGTLTLLASAAFTLVVSTTFALEFQWIYNPTELFGVELRVRTGTAADFSDLATKIHLIDLTSSGGLTSSVGQGLAAAHPAFASSPAFRVDTSRCYGV